MPTFSKRRLVLVAALAALTAVTAYLWVGALSTPLGRANAAELFHVLGRVGLAIFLFGSAVRQLPERIRPDDPYAFALKVVVAAALVAALAVA